MKKEFRTPIRMIRLDVSAIEFSKFEESWVSWLAEPWWFVTLRCGEQTLRFDYRITPEIYANLRRHHRAADDRRLKADDPPSAEWFDEAINSRRFIAMPQRPPQEFYTTV